MSAAPCLFDDREHGLRELLPQWPIAHLPVADIWIGVSHGEGSLPLANGIMIERKSAADLEASILDGRYREQRSRLMTYATERKAHVAYIIEGELDRLGATLTKQALMKHITRLALRYKIAVFQTACIKETAELCALLRDQWTTDPTTFEQPTTMTYIETRGKSRQENSDDPAVFATSVLQACRGISTTGAQALLAVFKNLEGIMAATQEQFAAVQVGKQKIGQVKAARLYSLLHSPPAQ
jgi:ERCC4-type nuclease